MERNALISGAAKPFAEHGFEKMLYDARMGPVSIVRNDVLYVAYGGSETDSLPHPHLVTCDLKTKTWSQPIRPALLKALRPDHHFNPVLWFDADERLHMLYETHCSPGTHIYTPEAGCLSKWVEGPQIAPNITYPRMIPLPDGRLLMFYRVLSHMGFWTYITSPDGGFSWSKPVPLVDFDQNAVCNDDDWAGSYHAVRLSRDGKSLHLGFNYFHERGSYSWIHPIYGVKPGVQARFHLYYVKVDIETGRMTDIDGNLLPRPLGKNEADAVCKVWDTGLLLTNIPSILPDEQDRPSFLLTVSTEEAMNKCNFWYVHRRDGEWKKSCVCPTNSTWSGSALYRDENGRLLAYLSGIGVDGSGLTYGGGTVQRWSSADGEKWTPDGDAAPVADLLYNNPQFPEKSDGSGPDTRFLLLFGWKGPGGLISRPVGPGDYKSGGPATESSCRGMAFAAMNGQWI